MTVCIFCQLLQKRLTLFLCDAYQKLAVVFLIQKKCVFSDIYKFGPHFASVNGTPTNVLILFIYF